MTLPDRTFARLLEAVPDAVLAVAADGTIAHVNSQAEALFGYPAGSLAGRPHDLLVPEARRAAHVAGIAAFFAHPARHAMASGHEIAGLRADGSEFPAECFLSPLEDDGGPFALAVVRDLSGRLSAEQALREGEARYRELFEANPHPMWVYDLETLAILAVNDAAVRKYGYTRAEFLRLTIADIRPPEDVEPLRENVARVSAGLDEAGLWRHVTKEGAVLDVEIVSHTLDWDGRRAELVLSHDVTESRQAEKRLQESEERLRLALKAADQGLYDVNVQTGATVVNDQYAQMLGYEPLEFVESNTTWIERLHPDDREPVAAAYRDYVAGELSSFRVEFRQRTKSGGWKWILSLGEIVERDREGRPLRMLGTHTDITERKEAEEALRRRGEQLEKIVATSPGVVCSFRLTPDGSISFPFAGPGIEALYGVAPERLAEDASVVFDLIHPDDIGLVRDSIMESARTLGPWLIEFRVRSPSRGALWLEGRSMPQREPDGSVLWHGIVLDVTDRKRAEREQEGLQAQLAQAQKMEAVGRLAGGVAHDFNNMLAVILGRAELALHRVGPEGPLRRDLGEVLHAAERSAVLTRQLLAFARKQTVSPQVLDLNDAVGAMIQMLRRLIGEDVEFAWVPGAGVWNVRIDPSQLDQILANLVVNARDAIAGTGRITLETRNVVLDEAVDTRNEVVAPGEYVLLTVSDDGCGMDEETLAHLFEPFFTTKGPGQGTGLGLATVYGTVRQNGGFVDSVSESGRGSTFRVYLPRAQAEGTGKAEPPHGDAPQGGTETVLLVEDEAAILTLGLEMLEELGYRVLSAGTPGEALRIAEAFVGDIHLLVTDVVMPKMNGRELSERLAEARPGLRCLFLSGYTADVIAHRGVLDEGVRLLEKPFTLRQLAEKVREAIERKPRTKNSG